MLPSNGREANTKWNYHMTIQELSILLKYLKENVDPKFFVMVLTQFGMGMRCSEMLHINMYDFRDKYSKLTYRQAKSNEILPDEPVPEPLQKIIIAYIYHNAHRMIDGYLFSDPKIHNKKNKMPTYTTETYGSYWAKWRQAVGKKHPGFLDHHFITSCSGRQMKMYRIGTHSLRRLHRTVLANNVENPFILKELCNYKDISTLDRYVNGFKIREHKAQYLDPIIGPVISDAALTAAGQTRLGEY